MFYFNTALPFKLFKISLPNYYVSSHWTKKKIILWAICLHIFSEIFEEVILNKQTKHSPDLSLHSEWKKKDWQSNFSLSLDLVHGVCKATFLGVSSGSTCWNLTCATHSASVSKHRHSLFCVPATICYLHMAPR